MTQSVSSPTTSPSTSKWNHTQSFLPYRLCNLGTLLDDISLISNLNPSFIAETVTRQLVGSYTKLPALMADITYFTTLDPNNL